MANDCRWFDPKHETMPRLELQRLQEARLIRQVSRGYALSPRTRDNLDRAGVKPDDIQSMADFQQRVPTMSKDAVRAFRDERGDPFGGVACVNPREISWPGFVASSSGTTGAPSLLPQTANDTAVMAETQARILWEWGARAGDLLHILFFPWHPSDLNLVIQKIGASVVRTLHSPTDVHRFVEVASRLGPDFCFFMSGPFRQTLNEEFKRQGRDPRDVMSRYKAVAYGGEAVTPALRAHLQEEWGTTVFDLGGLSDFGLNAAECRERNGQHVAEDLFFVETLSPDGDEVLPPGQEGELTYTPLMIEGMSFLRFRSDDIGAIEVEPCACGRTHLRQRILGRKGDRLNIGGHGILPIHVARVLERESDTANGVFQIYRSSHGTGVLHLRVGHNGGPFVDAGSRRLALEALLARSLGVSVIIDEFLAEQVIRDEAIQRGLGHKLPRVI